MAGLNIGVVWQQKGSIQSRLKAIGGRVDPRSRKMDRLRTDLKKIAISDNKEKLLGYGATGALAGVDKAGKQLAKLGEWAKGKVFDRRGHGPVIVPHGLNSLAITRFKVRWVWQGTAYQMWLGWPDIEWMKWHLSGGRNLPKRDIGGISPKGMNQVRARFQRFAKTIPTSDD